MLPGINRIFVSLILATVALLGLATARADGTLGYPLATPIGTFGGIPYVQYDGLFSGHSSSGAYNVPYRISAPVDPARANHAVLVEASHFAIGLGALNVYLRRNFLFPRGFVHAGIGWSTAYGLRILDPGAPGVFINGGFREHGGNTDDEIIADFARALVSDANARTMLGTVARRYLTGFSDSSYPVLRLVTSGGATGVFDFALPITAEDFDPQAALAAGRFGGKLIVVNSEAEDSASFFDRGVAPTQYRFFDVAGTPHVPDPLDVPSPSNHTTPASYEPELRAHFLQGHRWVEQGTPPPPSTQLAPFNGSGKKALLDANGNAIAVDGSGRVSRLPFIELGEARFIPGFRGELDAVKSIQELGFADHRAYLKAFAGKVADYVKAGFMLNDDADVMRSLSALCPPLTFTQVYRDHYEAFKTLTPCGP